ncbi:GNAT family N-acetyltransferase [Nocardia terpenica]|uniref:GNAT family N-acetyltransferase n=1 Tax=Nocardia terpenica TaxID=455432 RepID=A0A6G9Z2R1_9NOCA|nr:GNAT family N-acetyltransferase [Nocardia terpenica]QIS19476.1 GNAT family N-acetyltransferase [Nocardia terpenica]
MASLFCDPTLARRIERAEVELIARGSEATRQRIGATDGFLASVAGGVAAIVAPGSPLNKVAGLGFGGIPSVGELEEIEAAFSARQTPVQVELAHLADPGIAALLTERGYRLTGFENVLGRALSPVPARVVPAGLDVRPSGDSEFDTWLDVIADAFAHPDTQGVPSHEKFPRDIVANAMRDMNTAGGMVRYLARRNGTPAGGAGLRMSAGIAQFTGAGTLPAHRHRGVQTALLSTRLADAAEAGCDLAVITTQPASRSQQNAQSQGFDLLYTRAILVKDTTSR